MNRLMNELLTQLESISHRADEYELTKLLAGWRNGTELPMIRQAIAQWLSESAVVERLRGAARETSTHYVWPLYVCGNGYGLTINEFKDPEFMAFGYANTLHNHRYSFASLVLSGGYRQVRGSVELSGMSGNAQVSVIAEDSIIHGNIVAMHHQEFHRLTHISDRTVTLVAKCPAVKESSISVDIKTLKVSRHVPVESRLVQLTDALIAAGDMGYREEESNALFA
jgi:hypothetical protein